MESLCVKPPRVAECPVQMEGMVHGIGACDAKLACLFF